MTALASSPLGVRGSEVICTGVVHVYPGGEGPIVALRNVELEVRAGEMIAFLGPSGSGKSTLLAVLSGLLRPTTGKVLVAGHDMARLDEHGLGRLRSTELALLLQDPLQNLIPDATVRETWRSLSAGRGGDAGRSDGLRTSSSTRSASLRWRSGRSMSSPVVRSKRSQWRA